MKNSIKLLGVALSILGLVSATESVEASSFGLGINYSSGNYAPVYGAPIYGYGSGFNGMAGINQCSNVLQAYPGMGIGGGFGNGMMGGMQPMPSMQPMMPQMPMLPPPPQRIPPHIAMGGMGGMGGGGIGGCNGGMPMMGSPMLSPCGGGMPMPCGGIGGCGGGCGGMMPRPMPSPCSGGFMSPCAAGMMQQQMMPVAGGPMINAGASVAYTAAQSGIYNIGGQAVVDLRERDSGYGDVVWAAALGLGMQTTNVYPIAFPRNDPFFQPFPYSTGPRDYGFYPRPTTSH